MTTPTFYVSTSGNNSNDGRSINTAWRSIAYAVSTAPGGAVIMVAPGTYKEIVSITKDGQVLTALDARNKPVIDGGYGPHMFGKYGAAAGKLPNPTRAIPTDAGVLRTGIWGGLINVRDRIGVVVENMYVRNSAGSGVNCGGASHGIILRNCRIDFTYSGAIMCGNKSKGAPRIQDPVIEGNVVTRSSMKLFHPNRSSWDAVENVDVTIKPVNSDRAIIRNNVVAYVYGEGIAASAGSRDILIEGNYIINSYHWSIGINASQNATVRNNVVMTKGNFPVLGNPSAGIVIGDEIKIYQQVQMKSDNFKIYNNLIIGTTNGIEIRGGDRYVTRVKGGQIIHNTVIGINGTSRIVRISPARDVNGALGPDHESLLISDNIFIKGGASAISVAPITLKNVVCRNNAWSEVPTASLVGAGDIVGPQVEESLIDYDAVIDFGNYDVTATNLDPTPVNFDKGNYKLRANAAVIGKGSNQSTVMGITPAIPYLYSYDAYGTPRTGYLGSGFDLGWNEYVFSEEPPPPPPPPDDKNEKLIEAIADELGITDNDLTHFYIGPITDDGRRVAVWADTDTTEYVVAFIYSTGVISEKKRIKSPRE